MFSYKDFNALHLNTKNPLYIIQGYGFLKKTLFWMEVDLKRNRALISKYAKPDHILYDIPLPYDFKGHAPYLYELKTHVNTSLIRTQSVQTDDRINGWNYLRSVAEFYITQHKNSEYMGLYHTPDDNAIGAQLPVNTDLLYCPVVLFQKNNATERPWIVFFCGSDDISYYRNYKTEHDARHDLNTMNGIMPHSHLIRQN